jgi:hypothetical protein
MCGIFLGGVMCGDCGVWKLVLEGSWDEGWGYA